MSEGYYDKYPYVKEDKASKWLDGYREEIEGILQSVRDGLNREEFKEFLRDLGLQEEE